MFRCDNCGSGYSMRAAASWDSCPRCLAKERVNMPLKFELGWKDGGQAREGAHPGAVGLPSEDKASSAAVE